MSTNLPTNSNSDLGLRFTELVTLFAMLLWSYTDVLSVFYRKWDADPQYSHGFLVPLIAVFILWLRWPKDREDLFRWSSWGVVLLVLALLVRHVSIRYYIEWFEQLSFVACVLGLFAAIFGLSCWKWYTPSVVFLAFAVPLPHTLEVALREPLRRAGTLASTYFMQGFGLPAFATGNSITIGEAKVDVVGACSGLRMMMVFFALSTAVAICASSRPMWQRAMIIVSAIPIAIFSNVIRITLTGTLYALNAPDGAHFLHDHAEWLMMPLALGLHLLELWIFDKLFIPEIVDHRPAGFGDAPAVPLP
ncbi:exosortase/archaeosortase family protein [Thalassoroseus pseudoceratinae]|uniref:exosortase/archaeosortase family protein n=1 Tax=Thalassoroseus pseudoceratinae TaxID=2713176 RepID=UPI001421D9CF|nr:exosortase/archaeosortase family protein [Thalassoroseus pseudoceratinae]